MEEGGNASSPRRLLMFACGIPAMFRRKNFLLRESTPKASTPVNSHESTSKTSRRIAVNMTSFSPSQKLPPSLHHTNIALTSKPHQKSLESTNGQPTPSPRTTKVGQRQKIDGINLVYGNLGNIRGNTNYYTNKSPNLNMLDIGLPETPAAASPVQEVRRNNLEAEELKEMGNEECKKGRFVEALVYYDKAIEMDGSNVYYHCNKAVALAALGQIGESVEECKGAVKIQHSCYKAHHTLATLYLRLGEPEKAIQHFKLSRNEASSNDISSANAIKANLAKSNEARKFKDYTTQLKESQSAATSGADISPKVIAMQAEALLNIQRHEEANTILNTSLKLGVEESTKLFGAMENAYCHMVRAKVKMSGGRFDEAVAAAQKAAQLDPGNREIAGVFRKAKAVSSARTRGNDLFKASRTTEACIAYGEGLEHDPHNTVILYNRAACYSKLGHYQKAIEDCDTALTVRPSYTKARYRRACCNAKLERWEACIKDFEILKQEIPGDEEVSKALSEARDQLNKQQRREREEMALE